MDTKTLFGGLLAVAPAFPAAAEDGTPPLSPRDPDELARTALAGNPALSALEQRLAAAREPPRVFRRPQSLRGWGHGKAKPVFT